MAGSPAKAKKYDELADRADKAETALSELRKFVAAHAPELLDKYDAGDTSLEPVTKYTPAICSRIVAMGRQGMGEMQWIAALGLSAETWKAWALQHAPLMQAAKQAHAAMQAYWQGEQTRALKQNNTRFPTNVARDMIGQELSVSAGGKGDASSLVVLDLTHERCPHCLEPIE